VIEGGLDGFLGPVDPSVSMKRLGATPVHTRLYLEREGRLAAQASGVLEPSIRMLDGTATKRRVEGDQNNSASGPMKPLIAGNMCTDTRSRLCDEAGEQIGSTLLSG
jgi:hypothetical protein